MWIYVDSNPTISIFVGISGGIMRCKVDIYIYSNTQKDARVNDVSFCCCYYFEIIIQYGKPKNTPTKYKPPELDEVFVRFTQAFVKWYWYTLW